MLTLLPICQMMDSGFDGFNRLNRMNACMWFKEVYSGTGGALPPHHLPPSDSLCEGATGFFCSL